MKCIKRATEIRRVGNEEADKLVKSGGWGWCDKKAWKESLKASKKSAGRESESEVIAQANTEKAGGEPKAKKTGYKGKKGKASFRVSHKEKEPGK